jgi:hypothetical protein
MSVLPPELQARVVTHVDNCVVCRALGEALDDSSVSEPTPIEQERIHHRVRDELRKSTRPPGAISMWQIVAAAAGVVLLIAGTVRVWQSRRATPAIGLSAAEARASTTGGERSRMARIR